MKIVKSFYFLILSLVITVVAALPHQNEPSRIVGGETVSIQQYPYAAALMNSMTGLVFTQSCGGTIINNRSILTAAHCFIVYRLEGMWRSRVGSSYRNSGGTVFETAQILRHPNFHTLRLDFDIAILRVSGNIVFGNTIAMASIAGTNYIVADNQPVTAIGWGLTCEDGCSASTQLRHVQIFTINRAVCQERYNDFGYTISESMFCSGVLDVGGRDACGGDSGGPVIHNNVIIGITSWGEGCARARYPGVNALVSIASNWIVSNA